MDKAKIVINLSNNNNKNYYNENSLHLKKGGKKSYRLKIFIF